MFGLAAFEKAHKEEFWRSCWTPGLSKKNTRTKLMEYCHLEVPFGIVLGFFTAD